MCIYMCINMCMDMRIDVCKGISAAHSSLWKAMRNAFNIVKHKWGAQACHSRYVYGHVY